MVKAYKTLTKTIELPLEHAARDVVQDGDVAKRYRVSMLSVVWPRI
jgi:hypothetical protein